MKKEFHRVFAPVWHFLGHTVVGTLIFLIVAIPAVGLSLLVQFLKDHNVVGFTIVMISALEHAILVVDSILLLVYIGVTALKTVKEMWHDER